MRTRLDLPLVFLLSAPLFADVERVELESVELVAGGKEFGEAGAYEALRGKIHFSLDPEHPANAAIVDLGLAPRNEAGEVEAVGDLIVLRTKDPERASGAALLEVSNRGGMASLRYFQGARRGFDPASEDAFGDGLLMERGVTLIWVGWQFDVPAGRPLRLEVPTPVEPPLSGLVRSDWVVTEVTRTLPLAHRDHRPYPASDPASEDNVLTVRDGREAERELVPRDAWSFAREEDGERIEDRTRIHLATGFEPGRIYELVYRAEGPAVVGLGLAAIRDTMAYAKYDEDCPFPVTHGVAVGISQTGRFLRHFLYQGFNTDEQGRRVYDGMLIHSAGAGRGSFNHRFAQPSRDAHRYSAFFYPTDLFPFSGRAQRDPLTGRTEGLLPRENLPRIFTTNTGYEYWGRAASLLHTSLDGSADVEPLENERIYHLRSCQHFPAGLSRRRRVEAEGVEVWRVNPNPFLRTERALLVALFDWVTGDVPPPPSAYPRIDAGSLVPIDELEPPSVPRLAWPEVIHVAYRADYGERWGQGIVDRQPPRLAPAFPSLVSQVDALGNEVAGVPTPELLVPIGTYTPWSLRTDMPGEEHELDDFYGSFVPLALTDEARDPEDSRPSLASLYESYEAYEEEVRRAALGLVQQRLLLGEDVARVSRDAYELWNWMHRER